MMHRSDQLAPLTTAQTRPLDGQSGLRRPGRQLSTSRRRWKITGAIEPHLFVARPAHPRFSGGGRRTTARIRIVSSLPPDGPMQTGGAGRFAPNSRWVDMTGEGRSRSGKARGPWMRGGGS